MSGLVLPPASFPVELGDRTLPAFPQRQEEPGPGGVASSEPRAGTGRGRQVLGGHSKKLTGAEHLGFCLSQSIIKLMIITKNSP